jgi:hypothetical protein
VDECKPLPPGVHHRQALLAGQVPDLAGGSLRYAPRPNWSMNYLQGECSHIRAAEEEEEEEDEEEEEEEEEEDVHVGRRRIFNVGQVLVLNLKTPRTSRRAAPASAAMSSCAGRCRSRASAQCVFTSISASMRQGLTLVPISAQLELFCPLCIPTVLMNVSPRCSS